MWPGFGQVLTLECQQSLAVGLVSATAEPIRIVRVRIFSGPFPSGVGLPLSREARVPATRGHIRTSEVQEVDQAMPCGSTKVQVGVFLITSASCRGGLGDAAGRGCGLGPSDHLGLKSRLSVFDPEMPS